jgi:hypothetical protein
MVFPCGLMILTRFWFGSYSKAVTKLAGLEPACGQAVEPVASMSCEILLSSRSKV